MKAVLGITSISLMLLQISCANNLDFNAVEENNLSSSLETTEEMVQLGDMLMSKSVYESTFSGEQHIEEEDSLFDSSLDTRLAQYPGVKAWPNGTIPVKFHKKVTSAEKKKFFTACKKWGDSTSVNCINRSNQKAYLHVVKSNSGNACMADLGYSGKKVSIYLPNEHNCFSERHLLHEIGHILGFMHEHQRPDRDKHIIVNWNRIPTSQQSAYTKYSGSGTISEEFDFKSIMLYGSHSADSRGNVYAVMNMASNHNRGWNPPMVLSKIDLETAAKVYPKSSGGGSSSRSVASAPRSPSTQCVFMRGARICYMR